jgi:hypothetical protein
MRKVLSADKTDFPTFSSTTPIDGNMSYGIGWGVAFVEALKAAGKHFTRASFLKVLTSTTFKQTPALLPLRYTSGDHQGLNGGYLTTITSASATTALTGTIYQTDSTSGGPVKTVNSQPGSIPSWLK